MATTPTVTTEQTHEGLIAGFHAAWALVQHGSAHHIRLHLSNLKTARAVCQHLADELDKLILVAEVRLKEHEALAEDIDRFSQAVPRRQ